jgi:hypothetical protein
MVGLPQNRAVLREPIPIDARAADHLRYIRETMENAAEFTAVPGWGGVTMGLTALAAAWLAGRQTSELGWAAVWLAEAFVAVAIAAPAAATKALPGVWLLLYGTAIVTGGAFSVRAVPILGLCLMGLGAASLLTPAAWGNLFMATGFGLVQIGFGLWIALKYGG